MAGKLDTEVCLAAIPTSFATVSIGTDKTPLARKLRAIASAGFKGIELGFPDLVAYANSLEGHDVGEDAYSTLSSAAAKVKTMADELNLEIMLLQPFANFEGWPRGSEQYKEAFDRARGWINILAAAGCKTLQVGSTDSEDISTDPEHLAADLADLADLLAARGFRLAYENWCWSTHSPNWSDIWQLTQRANRPNIGLCLDTFQTAGGESGDPSTHSGFIESTDSDRETLHAEYKQSLSSLSSKIPADKIYLLQISDARKPDSPLSRETQDGLRPRGRWSHDFRPLPGQDGYLPIVPVARAVLETGFRGWFSVEVFDAKMQKIWEEQEKREGTGGEAPGMEKLLREYAGTAMESVRSLIREACG